MVVTSGRRDAPAGGSIDPLDASAARLTALDALARRDHASADLRRKLLMKGYDPTVALAVIERLRADGLLNDQRYVENFIGVRAARGHGPLRVCAELLEIGLPADLVEERVESYGDWTAQLERARQKRFGAELPTDYAGRRRQARFLEIRGFTDAQIGLLFGYDTDIDAET